MKNVIFIILIAFGLLLAFFYYRQYDQTRQQLNLANRRILDRDTQIYRLQKQTGKFGAADPAPEPEVVASPSSLGQLSDADRSQLKQAGLKNPEADLKEDLRKNQQEVLKQKSTLGGNMAIRDIQVLNARYALAYFEDGHQGGYMVLKYTIKPTGTISWTVLDQFVL